MLPDGSDSRLHCSPCQCSMRTCRPRSFWLPPTATQFSTRMQVTAVRTSLRAGHYARRLLRFLWESYPLLRVCRLGLLFDLDLRDNVQRTLFFTGCYERRYLRNLRRLVRSGDVFVDIGAHIGIHALIIAHHLQRRSCCLRARCGHRGSAAECHGSQPFDECDRRRARDE